MAKDGGIMNGNTASTRTRSFIQAAAEEAQDKPIDTPPSDDIGVYTSEDTLQEKIEHSQDPNLEVWWRLNRAPKKIPDKIFFASDGKWQGYFNVEKINVIFDDFRIYLDEWNELRHKPERTSFQGFTYRTPEVDR